jgi:hypothetical protein
MNAPCRLRYCPPVKHYWDPKQGGEEGALAREQRRLAAILAADVIGYSCLMEQGQSGTFQGHLRMSVDASQGRSLGEAGSNDCWSTRKQ